MQEPDVKIVAAPLPGIAIVREIFIATNEENLMHPVVAMSSPERGRDQFERHNYTISFEPIPKSCQFLDCPLCYRELEILQEPELLTIGKSRYYPDVIEATKRYRERRKKRAKELQFIKTAMHAMMMTNSMLDILYNTDDIDERGAVSGD
jgi:hypothetical protein